MYDAAIALSMLRSSALVRLMLMAVSAMRKPMFHRLDGRGMLEAKRTALQPDFAALMVKYYRQAGLKSGDAICCGMSGSFPGLCIAAVAAACEMGLNMRGSASCGSSMYGSTRLELPVVRILDAARQAGCLAYERYALAAALIFLYMAWRKAPKRGDCK